MRVGRIPYINCYPVYGAIDRGIVPMSAELVDGVPTALNHEMKLGTLDITPWSNRVRLIDVRYDGAWDLPAIGAVAAPAGRCSA